MMEGVIRRPVMVCMLLLGACMLGVVSHQRLSVELIPFAELPLHLVQVRSQRRIHHILGVTQRGTLRRVPRAHPARSTSMTMSTSDGFAGVR